MNLLFCCNLKKNPLPLPFHSFKIYISFIIFSFFLDHIPKNLYVILQKKKYDSYLLINVS